MAIITPAIVTLAIITLAIIPVPIVILAFILLAIIILATRDAAYDTRLAGVSWSCKRFVNFENESNPALAPVSKLEAHRFYDRPIRLVPAMRSKWRSRLSSGREMLAAEGGDPEVVGWDGFADAL